VLRDYSLHAHNSEFPPSPLRAPPPPRPLLPAPSQVYFLMYEGSAEQHRYAGQLQRERQAFEALIDAKVRGGGRNQGQGQGDPGRAFRPL